MKRSLYIASLLLCIGITLRAYSQSVTSSAGTTGTVGTTQISFTLGEAAIDTRTGSTVIITEGMQQPVYATPMNGIYTINSASGTAGTNFQSFTAAVSALNLRGINGAVTFNVASGTYTEQISLPAIRGARASRPILFQSASGDSSSVILTYTASSPADNFTVRLNGATYVTIKKISIQAGVSTYSNALAVTNSSSYNSILNCRLISQGNTGFNQAALYMDESATSYLSQYNTFSNNRILNGYYGILMMGQTTVMPSGIKIQGNIISGFGGTGVFLGYMDSVQVISNTIENGNTYGLYATNLIKGYSIQKNIFRNLSGSSIRCMYLNTLTSTAAEPGLVANNFFAGNMSGTSSNTGSYIANCAYLNYYGNSNHITNGSTISNRGIEITGAATSNVNLLNNIFSNNYGGGGYVIYVNINAISGVVNCDYNDLWSQSTSKFAYWGGSNCISLASWQSISGKDAHSVSADPAFISATDLHTNSPNVYRKGTSTVPAILTDIDGYSRYAPTPCLGADEFFIPANDAGISAINSPSQSVIASGATDLLVALKNFGVSNLSAVNIKWSINNGTINTYTGWGGNLTNGSVQANVNIGNYTFAQGHYTLKTWTDNPNSAPDENHANDTAAFSFYVCSSHNGSYTLGGSGATFTTFTEAKNALYTCGCSGPITINVASGTYTEQVLFPSISGSSATNTITFQSASGDSTSTVLSWPSSSGSDYAMVIQGSNYIFKKLTIQRTGTGANALVVRIDGSSANNTFTNNRVIGPQTTSSSASLILCASFTANCHNNKFTNNLFLNGYDGLYFGSNASGANGTLVSGNTFMNQYYRAIHLDRQISPQVKNNTIVNTNTGDFNYAIDISNCTNAYVIEKNTIDISNANGKYGLYIYNCTSTAAQPGRFSNNFIHLNTSSDGAGIYLLNSPYARVYHNSVNITGSAISSKALYTFPTLSSGCEVRNNILVNNAGGYAYYSLGMPAVSDYNDLKTNGTYLAFNNANCTTLAAWKSSVSPKEANSINEDPGFVSSSNLHATALLIDGSCQLLAVVADDIDNQTRSNPTDMGADEFSPSKTLIMTLFLQGLYNGTTMNKAQNGNGDQWSGTIADKINIELHQPTSPYGLIYTIENVGLSTNGSISVSIPITYNSSYYLAIRHRNSIETWTANPVSFTGNSITYNFTTSNTAAYGNNQLQMGSVYVIYSGDINQDGAVDGLDINLVANKAAAFGTGYIAEDLNGDGSIDALDMIIPDNNAATFVSAVLP